MDEDKKRRILFIVIIILNIGIPVLIAFKDAVIGGSLLVIGIWFINRSSRILRADARKSFNPAVEKNKVNASARTIFVQVVDNFGRDLLPQAVEKRMAEARAKANPRDNVVAVKFKVEQNQNNNNK